RCDGIVARHDAPQRGGVDVLMEARDALAAEAPDVAHLNVHAPARRLVDPRVPSFDDDRVRSFDRLLDADRPALPFRAGDREEFLRDLLLAVPGAGGAAIRVMLGELKFDVVGEDVEDCRRVAGREIAIDLAYGVDVRHGPSSLQLRGVMPCPD